jgi:hypothetical protein
MSPETRADLVLVNASVHRVPDGRAVDAAVAIQGGRIAAVGTTAQIERLVGPRTRRVDVRGRTVLAGFCDAHVHAVTGGVASLRCRLHDVQRGLPEYLERIGAYAEEHPDLPWIVGGGWAMPDFPGGTPDRRDLDRVVADRPVFLDNRDGHGAWVNSRALELADVTRDTPDPRDGRIERDAGGDATGTLHEGAMRLVERLIPPTAADEWLLGLQRGQSYLHSLGITAWQEASALPDIEAAYRTLAERGELTARVRAALTWDRTRGLDQIDELLDRRSRGPIGRFVPGSVKFFGDGVMENFTAALTEPYLDVAGVATDNTGIDMVERAVLLEAVTRLDAEGVQVHVHAIGDRAVRNALDAFAAAQRANGVRDSRHHIAHIQLIHPDDLPRFAQLGAVANAQALWAVNEPQMTELTIPFLGPERATWQYPYRSLLRAGARLAMGSDWEVSTPDPLAQIEVAVTRVPAWDRTAAPFLPPERLTLEQAATAFTLGSAYVNFLDAETGSLEPGKQADLVVLDRDLFAGDAGHIGDARVLLTLVQGEAVHEDGALES